MGAGVPRLPLFLFLHRAVLLFYRVTAMVIMHFEKTPYQRDLFGVPEEEINGKFSGWKNNARYNVTMTVILQIDTTNVSGTEYGVAPNITFLSTNQAIVNIYKTFSFTGSLAEFQEWYANQEASLQYYVDDLITRLNSARTTAGLTGNWYINYSLDDRTINVYGVSEP